MGTKSKRDAEVGEKRTKKSKTEFETTKEKKFTQQEFEAEHQVVITGDEFESFQSFDVAPFDENIMAALKDAGFSKPSPIQAAAWPIILAGKDLVAVAKTGSGKTLGFLLPIFENILTLKSKQSKSSLKSTVALVLAPTRELAMQISQECEKFNQKINVDCTCIYGGVPKGPQARALQKGPEIIIATPGRANDFLETNGLDLSKTQFLVLDEADRMLDMGFEPQIKTIIKRLPVDHQTLLFTATWPKSVTKLAKAYLRSEENQVRVNIGSTEELEANRAISQLFYNLDDSQKDEKLYRIIQDLPESSKLLVFANTKRRIDYLSRSYWEDGYTACAIHGGKTQQERDLALQQFTTGKYPILFATDIAARGLDIQGVTHVVNFDMTRDVESYIHRIGRTGRAGGKGHSITFWNKAFDIPCAPMLIKIASEAGQEVPEWLAAYSHGKVKKNKLY